MEKEAGLVWKVLRSKIRCVRGSTTGWACSLSVGLPGTPQISIPSYGNQANHICFGSPLETTKAKIQRVPHLGMITVIGFIALVFAQPETYSTTLCYLLSIQSKDKALLYGQRCWMSSFRLKISTVSVAFSLVYLLCLYAFRVIILREFISQSITERPNPLIQVSLQRAISSVHSL